jgi:hypothetical protein
MILRNEIGGFLPSPPDSGDFLFSEKLLPKLKLSPGDADLEPWCTEVSQQQMLSSCAGNMSADMVELCNGLDGLPQLQVSRLQIYFNSRSMMTLDGVRNESSKDQGVYIRLVFKSMNVFGVCPETDWPYRPEKVNERPSIKATWRALKNKIHSYYRISGTEDDMLTEVHSAIRGRHPAGFGIPVTEAFYKGVSGVIPPPRDGEAIHGYHAIMGMGVVGDDVRIRNSWGRDWGSGGYAVLHADWFRNGHVQDPWVMTNGLVLR